MMKRFYDYIDKLLNTTNPRSSRRFVTLIVALHFTLAAFFVLVVFGYVVFAPTPTLNIAVLKLILQLIEFILEWEAIIMISGLGFVSATEFAKIVIAKLKTKVTTQIEDDSTTTTTTSISVPPTEPLPE